MMSHLFQFDMVWHVVASVLDLLEFYYYIIIIIIKLLESHSFFVESGFLGMWPHFTFLMVPSMILVGAYSALVHIITTDLDFI